MLLDAILGGGTTTVCGAPGLEIAQRSSLRVDVAAAVASRGPTERWEAARDEGIAGLWRRRGTQAAAMGAEGEVILHPGGTRSQ
jgi:hypothetical protein